MLCDVEVSTDNINAKKRDSQLDNPPCFSVGLNYEYLLTCYTDDAVPI